MSGKKSLLHRLNTELEEGWEAKLKPDGRIYYVNHKTQTSSWLPPRENWHDTTGLPYGWETALDGNEKPYFINHVEKYTTREDPRQDPDYVEPPRPREVELVRDIEKGFGFVAGSEKPVVVRFVTEGGPSVDKLLPGDLILKINGEEVRRAPREKVIELVRSCRHSIVLTVCQPYSDNSSRKSAILTAAKKAKLKNNPSRVRFADAIMVNGASVASQQSPQESYMPFMPNVLKVFLENGQTKSFKYDNKTTVKDVVNSLQEKLNITLTQHFCLVLQNMKSNVPGKMTLLQEHETLAELAAKPAARHFRCLFRVAFVPHDAYDLLKEDPIAFEYFYMQCCNDVIHERFASEMKYDTALRLAALQIQQHAMSNNMTGKISIKAIEKESGLDKFVAHSLLENMKTKDLRKMLAQYMKMNQSLTAPGQKQLSALQAKLHYMKIVSELKTFGSRVFMVTLLDQKSEAMVLVGPKAGVSVVTNIKSYTLTQLADFDQIENIKVTKDGENMHRVDLRVKINNKVETIGLGLLMDDAQNFVSMVAGYYHIFVDRDKRIVERTVGKNTSDPNVPSYEAQHRVLLSPWAYPEDLVSEVVDPDLGVGGVEDEKVIDLSQEPPQYEEDEEYLSKIKQELGIKTDVSIEMAPSISEPPDLSDIIALASPGKISNGRSFEEGVTSFGRTSNGGDDSSSLNSSFSSQGASFKTVISASNNSSRAGSSTDLTSAHKNQNTSPISLMTFKASPQGRRGQPVLIANTESSRSAMASTSEVVINNQSPPPNSINTSASSSMNNSDSGFARNRSDRSLSDNNSSTTSLLGEEATERQALLGNKRDPSPQRAGVLSAARTNGGLDAESDTDSTGTPGGSPAKGRQLRRNSSIESALQSFGLHSPDMVPGADVDFQDLEENVKVTPNGTVEAINSVYSTQVYGRQRMYYDPDIIDLTNFPPPATPDDDSMLDFTELSNFPPPVFSSNSSLSSFAKNEQDPSRPPVLPPRSSSTPSRLERSASTGNCPDFLDDDIDALIAQFTIPPPPSSSEMSSDSHAFANSFSGAMPSSEFSLSFSGDTSGDTLDDEFAHLIIPPPPASSTSTPQAEEAPVVPASAPGSSSSVNRNEKTENASAKTSKMVFRHKRSSSLDVNSIRAARDQMDSASRSKSLDANRNNIDSTVSPPPSDNENLSARSDKTITGDSPATVSEKLHSLLQSLPNFAPELTRRSSDNDLVRTGSLRIYRSASLDFNPAAQKPSHSDIAPSDSTGFLGNSSSVPIFSRSSSLRLKPASRRPRSQSYDVTSELRMGRSNSETLASTADGSKSGKSNSNKDLDKTSSSSGSESFATLKAKLKDYRDMLLNRNKSTASKKYMMNEDSGQSSDSKKGSLGRSNSFTKLINQFNRRGSKSDDQTESLASADSNWELKEARPVTPPPPSGELVPESGNEKRVPVVRDALGLNRATLRPVSNTILNQPNVYMTYTYPITKGKVGDTPLDLQGINNRQIEIRLHNHGEEHENGNEDKEVEKNAEKEEVKETSDEEE